MAPWSVVTALLALCALDWTSRSPTHRRFLCALADEDAAAAAAEAVDDVEVTTEDSGDAAADGEESAMDGEANPEKRAAAFVDSAKDLQDKLGQLKALLDAKGEDADPQLKERLKGLEAQISSLGLDSLTGGLGGDEAGKKDLQEFLAQCIMLSMRRAGARRPSTMGALRRLGQEKLQPAEAANIELVRMSAVCIQELTDEELEQAKAGKMTLLPKHLVDKAATAEARDHVINMESAIWEELKVVAKVLQGTMGGGDDEEGLPVKYGLLFGIPFLGMIGFLGFKFNQMQKDQEQRSSGKKNKKKN